jgi:hypothetical protein
METAFMRFTGWAFFLIGLALLGWAVGFDVGVPVDNPYKVEPDRLAHPEKMNLRLVMAVAGGAITVVGGVLVGAAQVVAAIAARSPETLSHRTPANDAPTPAPRPAREVDEAASSTFAAGVAIVGTALLCGLLWLVMQGA